VGCGIFLLYFPSLYMKHEYIVKKIGLGSSILSVDDAYREIDRLVVGEEVCVVFKKMKGSVAVEELVLTDELVGKMMMCAAGSKADDAEWFDELMNKYFGRSVINTSELSLEERQLWAKKHKKYCKGDCFSQ
jgi:hypothetical protein